MKKLKIIQALIAGIAFIPPTVLPLDFFLKGDHEVITISSELNTSYYRVPTNSIGVKFIKPITKDKSLHVYMTTSEEKFNEKMYPNIDTSVNEDAFALSDEVFYSILKYELSKSSYFSGCKLRDIVNLLEAIDTAALIRSGRKTMISPKKWKKIRREIESEKSEQGINKLNLISSLIPRSST